MNVGLHYYDLSYRMLIDCSYAIIRNTELIGRDIDLWRFCFYYILPLYSLIHSNLNELHNKAWPFYPRG